MISDVLKTVFLAIGIGFIVELLNQWLDTPFLHDFFKNNLVTILVALLAINATTMGIVLTKIRDIMDKSNDSQLFDATRKHMLISIKEQITLIILSIVILSIKSSSVITSTENLPLLLNASICAIFTYALMILYDTAKSVLVIVDFNHKHD